MGESGCGKSPLSRALLNLNPATSGSIIWMGQEMEGTPDSTWLGVRKDAQMIFQDPLASLNPRMTVAQIIGEPLLIVCDEPVSALDVSIQAQIINLLKQLQKELGLALIFIAHDLAVVRHISHRIMVMYLGRAKELAHKTALYTIPCHPYTQALLSAIPIPDPELERNKVVQLLQGDLPSPLSPPSGCVFRTRCPRAQGESGKDVPALRALSEATQAAYILA